MNKKILLKLNTIFIIIILFILVFPKNIVYAEEEITENEFHNHNIAYFVLTPLGDLINKLVASLGADITLDRTTYQTKEIESDSNLKTQINIKTGNKIEEEDQTTINKKSIPSTIENKKGETVQMFTQDTEIPIIPVNVYSMLSGKIQLLDSNFWKTNETNTNTIWNFIKKIVNTSSHIVLYVSVALLITMLIWRSILFVLAINMQLPEKAKESKKIMDNIFTAIFMIIGVYIIMALFSILYDKIIEIIMNGRNTFYPIRLIVDDVYSFNTNIISIVKYITLSTNLGYEFVWSVLYFVCSIAEGFVFIVMFIRMILIGILSIMAPFTAIMKMTGKSESKGIINFLHFKNWIKVYLQLMYRPVIIALFLSLLYKII